MEILLWEQLLMPYELAVDEVVLKLEHIRDEYRRMGRYSPIEEVTGRVKKISSILEKADRRRINEHDILNELQDIAGIRIICQFVDDIYTVSSIIQSRKDMKVLLIKDYIKEPKSSGYRSYHMIVEYHVETIDGGKDIPVEIQIRTMAMNFWATIEHSLQYKYDGLIPDEIRERLNGASNAVVALDSEMKSIHGEIMDAQNSFTVKANIVSRILRTIQNLYSVANKAEVEKFQDEFFTIYREGNLDNLQKFGKELDIIAEGYRAQNL